MRIKLRPVLIGLIVLVGVVGLVKVVPQNGAQPNASASAGVFDGACTAEHPGVSLVLDFGPDSGRAPLTKCAVGFNQKNQNLSGWQLFAATKVAVAGTTEFPVGFVCRVDGYPLPAEQPCTSTPTYAQGHWAYFYAESGQGLKGHWIFSGAGALQRKPACGSAEGWLFVKGEGVSGTMADREPSVPPQVFSCAP